MPMPRLFAILTVLPLKRSNCLRKTSHSHMAFLALVTTTLLRLQPHRKIRCDQFGRPPKRVLLRRALSFPQAATNGRLPSVCRTLMSTDVK